MGRFLLNDRLFRAPRWRWMVPSEWKFVTKRWRKCGAKQSKCRVCLPACCSFSEFLVLLYLICGVWFSLRLLSYGDGDPSEPHMNLRGKHFLLLFCVTYSCFWENCVPKIDLTRAIFSTLGDCFETPLLRRFLLVSIHNYDWQIFQGWNWGIGIVTDWVLLFSSHTFRLKMAGINYIWSRPSVRTWCVKFQAAD